MTHQLEITVPHKHEPDPTCPHCHVPLGTHLDGLYPGSDPHACGGEHRCPNCDGHLRVSVFRPEAVFGVSAHEYYGENVTHMRR